MSPGTTWEPFELDEGEYSQLVEAVKSTPVSEIEPYSRFAHIQYQFDNSFDEIEDFTEWFFAVCEEYRDNWYDELRRAGKLS